MKFPEFKGPDGEDAYFTFLKNLNHLRQRSYSKPLSFPYALPVLKRFTEPRPPPGPSTKTYDAPDVPQHHQPTKRVQAFPHPWSPEDMKLVLCEKLQTGRDGWSQAYTGKLTIGTRTCDVVVKLYQECMFRDPSSTNFYGPEGVFDGDWMSGTEVAQREAWSYNMLDRYQGSTIPYSYGFYEVTGISFKTHFIH
jgi:hypothetical protein